jgi:hypothetical protein
MTLNINGFVQERKDRTENCGGGWLAEKFLIPLVFLKPYILKVSFCLLLDVIKDIRKIAFKQEIFTI